MRPEWDDGPATNGCSVIPYGRLIVAARVLAGWSQAELSLASGVSERTLQRLERGDTGASIGTVSAILKALERRGVVLSGGDRQIRSGVQVLRGTDADRQLEEEMARGASVTKDTSGPADEGRTGDAGRADAADDRHGGHEMQKAPKD
jgi:transcriptional regulator with XRE-family HTH domain